MSRPLEILGCHGSGNDFVLVDELAGLRFSDNERVLLALSLCDRRAGLGADGLLFVQRSERAEAKMRMFNPDGSEAQTCGNGLRCVARYASETLGRSELTIETMGGTSRSSRDLPIAPGVATYATEIGPASLEARDLPLAAGSERLIDARLPEVSATLRLTALAVPNPHLIAFVPQIDTNELRRAGRRAAEAHSVLPEGANVSFCRPLDVAQIAVATFERGAGLTKSCGSGMAAATLAACVLGRANWNENVTVFNAGGFVTTRALRRADERCAIRLSGNATFEFEAEVEVNLERRSARVLQRHDRIDETTAYEAVASRGLAVFCSVAAPDDGLARAATRA